MKEQKIFLNKNIKSFMLYFVVACISTLTEWFVFWVLDLNACSYIAATTIAYIISTFVNWFSGRILVFKQSKRSFLMEMIYIYSTGAVGLVLNLLIMYFSIELLQIHNMLSKVIATGLVFSFNFLIRKYFIYK